MTDCNCPKCQALPTKHRLAAERDEARQENEWLRERVASLMLEEPSKTAGLYAALDELQLQLAAKEQYLDSLRWSAIDEPQRLTEPPTREDLFGNG